MSHTAKNILIAVLLVVVAILWYINLRPVMLVDWCQDIYWHYLSWPSKVGVPDAN